MTSRCARAVPQLPPPATVTEVNVLKVQGMSESPLCYWPGLAGSAKTQQEHARESVIFIYFDTVDRPLSINGKAFFKKGMAQW